MAITIEKCPHCGAPYMSAMIAGENPAERMCYSCNKRAGEPRGTAAKSAPRPKVQASPDDELSLQPIETEAAAGVFTTHKQPDARGQIKGQIQASRGPAVPGLPNDAPEYEEAPKAPLFTVASSIRLAVLLVVLVVVAKFVYSVYQKEFDKPVVPTAPPAAVPTVAEVTKAPVAPTPAVVAPEVKPIAPSAPVKQAPIAKKELASDGGGTDDAKSPTKTADVNDLIATDSRQKSRSVDDDDAGAVMKKSNAPPPAAKSTPPAKGDEKVDPMVALLEKTKNGQPPPAAGNNPPPNNPNGPNTPPPPPVTRPAGPVPPPNNNNPNAATFLPQGPVMRAKPEVVQFDSRAVSGVTFLSNYPGWFCKDYDDAHSLRESNIQKRINVIMMKPILRNPAKLTALIEIPKQFAGKKPVMILEVTGKDPAHSWFLHASIEGADVLQQQEIKITAAKPWNEVSIDLSNFTDRRFFLQIEIMPPPGGNPDAGYAGYIRNMHLDWAK